MKNRDILMLAMMVVTLSITLPVRSQSGSSPIPVVKTAVYFDVSPPLRDIPLIPVTDIEEESERNPELQYRSYPFAATALPKGPDPVWQQQMGTIQGNKAPLINFEGNPYCGFPPDCNGEVGPSHYFQTINVSFQIFNKTGSSLYGPTYENTIWSGLPGASDYGSDPIVLYDQQADRWFFSDITHDSPWYIRVAVSQTNDPTGSWYRWVFYFGSSLPDYPKYGVWRDGYYFACNLGGGLDVGVLERDAMLAGSGGARFIQFSNSWRPNSGFHAILPFDNDGAWASYGTPGQFITVNDDAWGGSDQLWLYTFTTNWTTPLSSSFSRTQVLGVAAFDANFGPTWDNIYQKGVSQRLDAVPQVLMHRAQYRNFGSYQSLVCCHSVDVDNTDHAGIRWYELRRAGGSWYIQQQGTYAPDADSRWMGSIAQNQYGDIAVGYSVSSTNTYPSIRFTGRRAGDAGSTMTITEQSILAGTASQTGGNRWGDYSGISIDPNDDKTFWYTNEYVIPGPSLRTRVAAFSFGTECTAYGGCDEFISRVQAGTIDNATACLNYSDYTSTQSTNLPVNGIVHVTVTNGPPAYSGDQCGIWVDWNRNGSFYDANEQITVTGTTGPYTATIIPPAGQTLGNCTMRIRINYGAVDPCGTTTYGEIEDYTLNITSKVPNVWTGNTNHYWHNTGNWSLEHIPTSDEDVIIPNVNMPCTVDNYSDACNNLTTYAGTNLLIKGWTLTVNGSLDIFGQLSMDNSSGALIVGGNIYWESGSNANITAASVMWIYGYWEFRPGANVQLANGYVDFTGSSSAFIRVYSPNCSFNNVGVYKSAGYYLGLSGASTNDLIINGYLGIQPNATFYGYSENSLILRGAFYNNYHFAFSSGTLVFDGVNQSIKPNTGDYVNNLTISPSGTTSFDNTYTSTLNVKGNLSIESGVFDPLNNTVEVAGDWINSVGLSGFTEGTGSVIFNGGNYHQYCSNETFYNLEINKPSGGAFRMNGTNVVCAHYHWTAGAVDVITGSFTANDLVESGLYGSYYVNTGGTVNLHNSDGYIDLMGAVYIFGGNFNIWGGLGWDSYWPFQDGASITMSGGVLDIKDVGVYVYPSYTFSENITGGTIRTSRGFRVERSDFTPSGNTIEFYGPTDGTLHTTGGGYVNNVIFMKSAVDNMTMAYQAVGNRGDGTLTRAPATSTVTVDNVTDIKGNVTIQSGVVSAGGNIINVEGNWDNQAGTSAFLEGTSTVEFSGALDADILSTETFYDLNLNKTYTLYDALELTDDIAVTGDLHILDGSMELNSPADLSVSGNVTIDLGAGLNANDFAAQITVGKNWTNSNTDFSTSNGFDPGGASTVTFNGTTDQYLTTSCPMETFNILAVNKSAGKFRPNDNIQCYQDINIVNGSWEDAASGYTHTLYRNFTVNSTGAYLTTSENNTLDFRGADNAVLTYSGGTGYFRNLLINKNAGSSVTQVGNTSCQMDGNLTINTGTYSLNGNNLFVFGDVNVNNNGILALPTSSLLVLSDLNSLNINSGGFINITGTAVNPVTIRANVSTARYSFNISSGGSIAADYCYFKNMYVNGVYVMPGATVDPLHAFKGCTFQDGSTILLAINNNQTLTIRDAVFPNNTWSGSYNVLKTLNTGHIYMVDYSGGFSGQAYEYDSYNLIDWVPTLTATPTATPGTICAGASSQLNAGQSGGYGSYTYAWSPATGLSATNIKNPVATPARTTSYNITVTDALGTEAFNVVTVTVNPVLTVGVTITASANPSPPGNWVTFNTIPVNGGDSPSFQWKKNGANVGTGLSTYSDNLLAYNDKISCVMTSSYACPSGNPATSNVITMFIVDANKTVSGTVPGSTTVCFDAINTITVAGPAGAFLVQNGGVARMIAGVNIRYLYGTTVEPRGYMHGWITGNNGFCGSLEPSMVTLVVTGVEDPEQVLPDPPFSSQKFTIYPNPATRLFTLLNKDDTTPAKVQVNLFDIRGNILLTTSYIHERSHIFTLGDLSPGLYFVKVISGDHVESFKLIVTR